MATLITGGAGFIGSRLAARLLADGETVIILDNFNDYYDPALKRANIASLGDDPIVIEGDVRDADLVERIFSEHDIRRVAHLAAMAAVRYSVGRGPLYSDINLNGSVIMMDAARKHDVEIFILASTSSIYGNTKNIPFVEDDAPDMPLAPYPASKRSAEIFAHSYHNLYDMNVTVLRFFNVYGPHGRPDMMPLKAIDMILKGETIKLFGDGLLERDWTYIDDTVDGILSALNRPLGYKIINLGHGSSIPFIDFIRIYEELIGKDAVTQKVEAPLTEPPITYCNNRRARDLLGFDPKVSIVDGLAKTWAWYKDYHNL